MRAKLFGFFVGFAAGLVTLSVLLWATGNLPRESAAAMEHRETLPDPRPLDFHIPSVQSADRALDPPLPEAMRLPANEAPGRIGLPIAGLKLADLRDTFAEVRGEARSHEAVDIMAPRGTAVRAAVEGNVVKLFRSDQGGLTVYQFDNDRKYCYYYAHLDRYAPGVQEGMLLRQGDLLGYVGSTGNADPAAPHLHFSIFRLGPDKKWWEGEPVNPYPLLLEAMR